MEMYRMGLRASFFVQLAVHEFFYSNLSLNAEDYILSSRINMRLLFY